MEHARIAFTRTTTVADSRTMSMPDFVFVPAHVAKATTAGFIALLTKFQLCGKTYSRSVFTTIPSLVVEAKAVVQSASTVVLAVKVAVLAAEVEFLARSARFFTKSAYVEPQSKLSLLLGPAQGIFG